MASTLFILNDFSYGIECSYNALWLVGSLSKVEGERVRVFLIGEGVMCAYREQKVSIGHYNIEVMLKMAQKYGADIGVCGSCMDVRGMTEVELVEGTKCSSFDELTSWTREVDKVIVF